MITVTVLYANTGDSFDMDYYLTKHMPMVAEKCGAPLHHWKVEQGIAGGTPDAPAPYTAVAHLTFDSVEAFQGAFGPHAEEILADVPNYTTIPATFQISEVRAG